MYVIVMISNVYLTCFRCALEGIDNSNYTEPWNSSLVLEAIPTNELGKTDSCLIYGENKTLVKCNSWIYDTQYYTSTRSIEWNLVCSRRWMAAAAQTIFLSGVVLGSVTLGPLCDKFGRRTVYLWGALLQLICGVLVAFTTEYYAFVTVRFIYGIFAVSPFKAGYVLMIELIAPSRRAICSALFQMLFGVGAMFIGVWGYLIDNRFYLQIVYGLHSILLLPHWFLLDESPRWLWAKGRIQESVAVIQKGLKVNRSNEKLDPATLISQYKTPDTHQSECLNNNSAGLLDLFRTPNMFKKSTIIFGCWFAIGVVYYGLSFNTGKFKGNPFLILFVSGLVELPGYAAGMVFIHKLGHRALLCSTMLISGIFCCIVVVLPAQSVLITVAAMTGKFVISASFAIVFKYSAELFPTIIRSTGVGVGTMCASLSAAIAPMIILLDSFDPEIPTAVFGIIAILFGSCALLLPETLGRRLPESLLDGESFGIGDNCFTNCSGHG